MVSKYFLITLLLTVLLQENAKASLSKEPKILQRITRQAGRYGANNYQPVQAGAYTVRGGGASLGTPVGSNISGKGQAVFKTAARPVGSGAYNFGGAATNGRQPAYGPNFALSSAGRQPSLGSVYGGQVQGGARPQANAVYRGTAGRPGPGAYQG